MGIKRRIKRLRYYCSWRYPKLFGLAQKLAFPVQVLTLCITLYMGVTFYQQHYSFEATARAHQFEQINTTRETARLALDTEIPFAAAHDETLATAGTTVQVQRQKNDDPAVVSTPSPLPQNEDSLPLVADTSKLPAKSKIELFNSEWILSQNNESFTIQLAISSDETKLKNYAADLPLTIPLAMYPFRVSTEGSITYGLSAGLFNSNEEALSALATLPEDLGKYGLWVRKIADISTQITALELTP